MGLVKCVFSFYLLELCVEVSYRAIAEVHGEDRPPPAVAFLQALYQEFEGAVMPGYAQS